MKFDSILQRGITALDIIKQREHYSRVKLLARNLAKNTDAANRNQNFRIRHTDLANLGGEQGNGILIQKRRMADLFQRTKWQEVPTEKNDFVNDLRQWTIQQQPKGKRKHKDILDEAKLKKDIDSLDSLPPLETFNSGEAGDDLYDAFTTITDQGPVEFSHFLNTYLQLIEHRVSGAGKDHLLSLNVDPALSRASARTARRAKMSSSKLEVEGLPFEIQDLLEFEEEILPNIVEIIRDKTYITRDGRILPKFTRKYKQEMEKVDAKRLIPVLGKVDFDPEVVEEAENNIREILSERIGERDMYSYILEAHVKAFPKQGIRSFIRRKKGKVEGEEVENFAEEYRERVEGLRQGIRRREERAIQRDLRGINEAVGDAISRGDLENMTPDEVEALFYDPVLEIDSKAQARIEDSLRGSRNKSVRLIGNKLERSGAWSDEEE